MRAKILISALALLVALGAAAQASAVEKSALQQLQQKVLRDYERERQRQKQRERSVFGGKTEAEYFARIPAGSFRMGNIQGGGDPNERPVHRVRVKVFLLSTTEITFAQWDACVAAGGCSYNPDDQGWGRGDRPVMNVSWKDITEQFIPWLNKITGKRYRLPTEAEWEYAARAGSETKYSWGDGIGRNKAHCYDCGSRWDDSKTAPVASFAANDFGVYDMHGNVWEWTQDCWNDSYRGAPSDGSAWLAGNCDRRVLRGGSWFFRAYVLGSATRSWGSTANRNYFNGFRVARTLD